MARAGQTKQFLRALRVDELRAIKREFCPRVDNYRDVGDKEEFIDKLRSSLDRSREKGSYLSENLLRF